VTGTPVRDETNRTGWDQTLEEPSEVAWAWTPCESVIV
jgi:hypothetical protein